MYLCFDSARVRVLQSPDIFWIILTSLASPKTNRVIEESVALFESPPMPRINTRLCRFCLVKKSSSALILVIWSRFLRHSKACGKPHAREGRLGWRQKKRKDTLGRGARTSTVSCGLFRPFLPASVLDADPCGGRPAPFDAKPVRAATARLAKICPPRCAWGRGD